MLANTQFWDELAIRSYRAILKKKPDSPLIHKNLGLAYARIGRLNKAARSFERAIKFDKGYAEAHYHLGTVLQKMGKKAEAIKYYVKYNQLTHALSDDDAIVEELLEKLRSE